MMEVWRRVPDASDYEISNHGRVRSLKGATPQILRPSPNADGYHLYALRAGGRRSFATAHALVMLAFVGPRPEGMEIRHLDGDPANNVVANLRYGTHAENVADMLAHGTHRNLRKTECPAGHPYDATNTYVHRGTRHCRACRNARNAQYRARRSAA